MRFQKLDLRSSLLVYVKNRICFVVSIVYQIFKFDVRRPSSATLRLQACYRRMFQNLIPQTKSLVGKIRQGFLKAQQMPYRRVKRKVKNGKLKGYGRSRPLRGRSGLVRALSLSCSFWFRLLASFLRSFHSLRNGFAATTAPNVRSGTA